MFLCISAHIHFIIILHHKTLLKRLERRTSFIWGSVDRWLGLLQPVLHPCSGSGSADQDAASLCVLVSGALLVGLELRGGEE